MDCINLELLHGPQRRQEGSEQSCSKRHLERGGSIAEICCTTRECAGVAGTQEGPSQGIATEIWVQAAADLQLEKPCGVKLCKEIQKVVKGVGGAHTWESQLSHWGVFISDYIFHFLFLYSIRRKSILQDLYQVKHWLLLLSCLS